MITASVKRLKYYPTIVTAVSVPVSIALAYANIWSMTTAEIVGAIGLTSSMTLSLFSMLTNNLVGFVYCDETQSKVILEHYSRKMLRKLAFSIVQSHTTARWIVPVARMSQYGPHFIEPIVNKEEISRLQETGELSKIAHVPIKAALSNQSSSVFYDPLVSQFTNYVMKHGNRELARGLVERGFENIKRMQLERYHLAESDEERAKIELNPRKLLHQAVENCRPLLQLTPIKRGGVRYQVPIPVTEKRSYFLAMKWLLEAVREKERTVHFPEKMAWEILDAAANQGKVVKRKHELHRQCEANRAYAHYRWS
uniref:Small ribosomal subunit protein uS7m n=2 Tax=Anopheles albimanus TaxID=7167 RepID=A0A182F2P5_ANOAL